MNSSNKTVFVLDRDWRLEMLDIAILVCPLIVFIAKIYEKISIKRKSL